MSDSEQDSFFSDVNPENDVESTIKFCEVCNNMLQPSAEEDGLKYKCNKPKCDYQLRVNSQSQADNLVSRIVNQKERNLIIDKEFCMDPTMPRKKIECPKCSYDEAAFLITSDKEDTKIELYYICCNSECDHFWKNKEPNQIKSHKYFQKLKQKNLKNIIQKNVQNKKNKNLQKKRQIKKKLHFKNEPLFMQQKNIN